MLPAKRQKRKRICRYVVVRMSAWSVWRFFSAEAGLLEFLVLRPDTRALHPVDEDVAILLNELEELGGCAGRPLGQYAEVRQAPQQDRHEVLHMVVGMAGTEAEMEAQHVEGGVGLEVKQMEEKLLPERVEVAFWPARLNLFDYALPTPFLLDGRVSRREGHGEFVELWAAYADEGLDGTVMLAVVQLFKFIVNHWLAIFYGD